MVVRLSLANTRGVVHDGRERPGHRTHGPSPTRADRSLKRLPSNLAHLPNLTYSRRGRDWLPEVITQLTDFVTWMQQTRHSASGPPES